MTARQSQAFSRMSVGSALYFAAEIIRLAVVMMVVVPIARLAGIGMMVVAAAEVNSGIGHGAADQREKQGRLPQETSPWLSQNFEPLHRGSHPD